MNKYIPYGRQWIEEDDIASVVEVLKGDYITTGPKISEFEAQLADYTGAKHVVAYSNGTAALHAACFAAGIQEGDEVITTPMTFAASANCILYVGGIPVFADICTDTYNINPFDIEQKITKKTKALIPVDFTGQPCDLDEIMQIAKTHNLTVIEDASHSIGAVYKGKGIGTIADMTTFSFHPVKNITTGEGGAVATNSDKFYEKLLMFRTHGITRDKEKLVSAKEGSWFYEQHFLGYNCRMTDIQAALGVSQLKKCDMFLEKRRKYAQQYTREFNNVDGLIVPYQDVNIESAWHLYIIQLQLDKLRIGRKEFIAELQEHGVGANVHYIPVYYHPYYQSLGYRKGLCPNTEAIYEKIITLPLFPKMEQTDVDYVINITKNIIHKHKK